MPVSFVLGTSPTVCADRSPTVVPAVRTIAMVIQQPACVLNAGRVRSPKMIARTTIKTADAGATPIRHASQRISGRGPQRPDDKHRDPIATNRDRQPRPLGVCGYQDAAPQKRLVDRDRRRQRDPATTAP